MSTYKEIVSTNQIIDENIVQYNYDDMMDILSAYSCKPNTSVVPRNCSVNRWLSVQIKISCRDGNARTMREPRDTRMSPAVLVELGVQSPGVSWSAQRISMGSKSSGFVEPNGTAPKAMRWRSC